MLIGIYKITNKITGEVYIGQSCSMHTRFKAHIRSSKQIYDSSYDSNLANAIREYGENNFEMEVLEQITLTDKEEYWIQKYKDEGYQLYNKVLKPNTDAGSVYKTFNEEEVDYIYELLKDPSLSNIKIAEIMNCSSSTIDNINNGKVYRREDIEYPIKQFKYLGGQYNHLSLFSNEEALAIRKRYVKESGKQIYQDYKDRCTYSCFEDLLLGRTYNKDIPVYKKREKQWYLNENLYRLEP